MSYRELQFFFFAPPEDVPASRGRSVARCRDFGLFIRDASTMGAQPRDRAIRIAVKDANDRSMIGIFLPGCGITAGTRIAFDHGMNDCLLRLSFIAVTAFAQSNPFFNPARCRSRRRLSIRSRTPTISRRSKRG